MRSPNDVQGSWTPVARRVARLETYTGTHTDHTRDRLATRVLPFFSKVLVFEAKQ